MRRLAGLVALAVLSAGAAHGQQAAPTEAPYTFEPSEYQQKELEFGGYAEGKLEGFGLDRGSAFYELSKPAGGRPGLNERSTGTLELTGKYHKDIVTLNFTAHADADQDAVFGNDHEVDLYEGGLSLQPETGLSFYLGKKTLLWGKGYAWNPVGFIQRPKDPTDPNLSREGFWMATADYTQSLKEGPVQTLGVSAVFVPTTPDLNDDFGRDNHYDVAGKLYMLVGHTDIDLMALSGGAKGKRYGADFSSAVTAALEVHGELAWIDGSMRTVLNSAGQPTPIASDVASYLLGLNYLTETDTTFIFEYYHNGEGFRDSEADSFFTLAHDGFAQFRSTGNSALLQKADMISNGYMRPNPMRDYLNFKVSQKEPFNILYFTPSLTVQANLTDHSFMILPELLYTGFKNVELRARAQANIGPRQTEFGEKQVDGRAELRARYFF
jgi:hypothetical protein